MAEAPVAPARSRGLWLLAVIFVLGLICGAALFHLGQLSVGSRPHGVRHEAPIHHLARELGLDETQREQVRELLHRSHSRVRVILEETHDEIRALLRPEQQERFDTLRPAPPEPFGRRPRGLRHDTPREPHGPVGTPRPADAPDPGETPPPD